MAQDAVFNQMLALFDAKFFIFFSQFLKYSLIANLLSWILQR